MESDLGEVSDEDEGIECELERCLEVLEICEGVGLIKDDFGEAGSVLCQQKKGGSMPSFQFTYTHTHAHAHARKHIVLQLPAWSIVTR